MTGSQASVWQEYFMHDWIEDIERLITSLVIQQNKRKWEIGVTY